MQQLIRLAHELGVQLVALTVVGMTPLQAIQAATVKASELIGWQDLIGTIETGKFADLIAVDGISDIKMLEKVKFVMKGGKAAKEFAS
jgi:imidazolonepropionase-like amidohydrolase